MPYQDSSYFVRLDEPPATSRNTPLGREQQWDEPLPPVSRRSSARPEPTRRRRRRSFTIRPVGVVLIALLAWVGWAYTTPGGPSARIGDWIDHTRTDVADVSLGPGLHKSANYFNQLYATQGSYPHMSDLQIQQDPNAQFGINMTYSWCSPNAVVLRSNGAGGSVSRLLIGGKDLNNVSGVYGCPADLTKPVPWKLPKE